MNITSADIAAARLRLPRAFGPTRLRRLLHIVAWLLALGWLVALCAWFDITPRRLFGGLSGLFVILRQMFPPSPGTQWDDILPGLGESVAMAFLGTLVAAIIALPLGFLGARNVVVNTLAHFSIRRVFDGFRGMDQLIWALAFVRAGSFYENYGSALSTAQHTGKYFSFHPVDFSFPAVGSIDIGNLVAELLLNGWTGKKVIELGSLTTANQMAAAVSKAIGRDVEAQAIPRQAWAETLQQFGLPPGSTGPSPRRPWRQSRSRRKPRSAIAD